MIKTEKKFSIAIQGIEGSFHELAAKKFFGNEFDIVPCSSFEKVISQVTSSNSKLAIMAIENSIAGTILPNYNLIANSQLNVVGEVYIKIEHHLMALPGVDVSKIKEVHSHPMALLQCEDYLHTLNITLIEKEDTAESAKNIKDYNLRSVAAVASQLAADKYGLEIIKSNIESNKNNYTRFLVLSQDSNEEEWIFCNKASIRFSLPHTSGSLAEALSLIAGAGLNLSKIQSVPILGKEWQYSFHLDIEFDNYSVFEKAMKQIDVISEAFSILGIYKQGKND